MKENLQDYKMGNIEDSFSLRKLFRSRLEWLDWSRETGSSFSSDVTQNVLDSVARFGLIEPLTGAHYEPMNIKVTAPNFRESIRCGRLISRQRALISEFCELSKADRGHLMKRTSRIYAPEGLTDFSLFMRGIFPRFLGSEYVTSPDERDRLFPIPSEDLMNLTFKDGSFDAILSNDVFEHIPDLDKALSECRRILAPGGAMVATFPMAIKSDEGVKKARIQDGSVVHLMTPEYHGNPMRPSEGSLVFEIPGWNMIDRARSAGFEDAYFSAICSAKMGILGAGPTTVLVFSAMK